MNSIETAIDLDASEVADQIDVPLEQWAGNCHGISDLVAPLVDGKVRRGYFIGEIARGSYFDGRPSQHSWIVLDDGRVVDPTRHAFVGGEPEIWVGDDSDYDVGGCKMAAPNCDVPDPWETSSPRIWLDELESVDYVQDLLWFFEGEDMGYSVEQLHYLATLPVKSKEQSGTLSRFFAAEVFEAIRAAGMGALIPVDREVWVLDVTYEELQEIGSRPVRNSTLADLINNAI